tara:strand:- start:20 stop:1060 length:1041 start_codon:yes stop_codon:yes gene_type:complete
MLGARKIAILGGNKFKDDWSLAFDGSDDYIALPDPFNNANHTISSWINQTANAGNKTIFDNRDGNNDGILLYSAATEKIEYQLLDSDVVTSAAVDVGVWKHVVATYDGTTQSLYIDGILAASATVSKTVAVTTNAVIGGKSWETGNNFLGNISEVAIYDAGMTASQVRTLYNSREPYNHKEGIASANLKGWWRMGDGALDSFNLIGDEVNPTIGPELVTNGSIGDGTGWTASNFAFSGGVATTSTNGATLQQALSFTSGDIIKITAEIKNYSSGSCRWYTGAGADVSRSFSSDGIHTHYLAGNNTKVLFYSDNFNGSIDNVSVKKVNGNSGAMFNMDAVDFEGDTP